MKIKSRALATIILVIIFGGIVLTTALGWWETANVRSPGGPGKGNSASQEHSETGLPESGGDHGSGAFINGQTTFWHVREAGVSEERIAEILGAEIPNTAMRVKDYCLQNGLPFSTIKKALQAEMDAQ
jgi:hypothetical protein